MCRRVLLTLLLFLGLISSAWGQTADALLDEADSLYSLQQYDAAKVAALKALPLTNAEGQQETRGDVLNLLSVIHVRQGDFQTAAKYAKACNELDLKSGDADNISSSYNTLAGIYMSMRQPAEAEKYILKAISYAQKVDNPQRMAVLQGMASEVYHHLKQEERSLAYATKAYDIYGHRHIEVDLQLTKKARMIILGDWITQFSYIVYDGEHLLLSQYIEGESKP